MKHQLMTHEVRAQGLTSHLEYAFLEGDNEIPFIIAKEFECHGESRSHKGVAIPTASIAWKHSDIKVINPEFCTHKNSKGKVYTPAVPTSETGSAPSRVSTLKKLSRKELRPSAESHITIRESSQE
ncbi:hypothetical protein Tco_0955836 [Tanacetum coccineum]|uniref:Uncharacterized protein n=1 Tax=Tanacetum coccineum TaxID=301880 RepID=A0ABQ5E8D8_9ASTR